MIDFSLTRPHQFSFWKEYLLDIRSDPVQSRICKQRVLCQTLAGNLVYVLTVTNPSRRPTDAEVKYEIQNPKWETSVLFIQSCLDAVIFMFMVNSVQFRVSVIFWCKENFNDLSWKCKTHFGLMVWKQGKQQNRKLASTFFSLDWKRVLD